MMRSSLALILASVALSSGCGDQAAVMQQCLAGTPEFAARLGSALQACGQVCRQFLMNHKTKHKLLRCPEVRTGLV